MNCCENKNITCKNYENVCLNCGTIHGYRHINEIPFRDNNMNISNMLFYKKTIYINVFILDKLMKTLYYFLIKP